MQISKPVLHSWRREEKRKEEEEEAEENKKSHPCQEPVFTGGGGGGVINVSTQREDCVIRSRLVESVGRSVGRSAELLCLARDVYKQKEAMSKSNESTLEYENEYRSTITPRTAGRSSTRTSGGIGSAGQGSGGRVLKIVTEMGSSTVSGISPAFSANAAQSFLEATEKEKRELQNLNDRLSNYIDRVKGLESQNRKLVSDLEDLRSRWGKDTSEIKEKYAGSLSDARRTIDDMARQKTEVEVQISRLQDDISEFRRRYDDTIRLRQADKEQITNLRNMINDSETEINMLRQRYKNLGDELNKYNKDNARFWDELQKARSDLDQETLSRIDFQNQTQTLLEELEFLRRVHDQEVKELQALLSREPTDTREFFKNELALAVRDIRNEYDIIAQQNKTDMESWYKLKVQEVQSATNRQGMEGSYQREEIKRMRDHMQDLRGKLADLESKNVMLEKQVQELNHQLEDDQRQYEMALNDRDAQLRKMREECHALVSELQALLDTKQMLDAEIAIYRKMLEGEESRAGLRQMVEQVVKSHSLQQQEETESNRTVRGEMSTRTTFQRSAKGNVVISECDLDGKFITLENTHRQKIWARDQGGTARPPNELIFDAETSWGSGSNVSTTLLNREGEERASHLQKTIQQG
ncbi:Intermediate filament protein B [Trichinella zimbabwensis]|uniref:Intermediate filament protein B n=1 Tax=Trichinella zimbabwensis TaxID=268475 RepID=A0A0V1HRT4_9BILA|nr:Intermediate filament protein B [Trichinella zimbabwensis]